MKRLNRSGVWAVWITGLLVLGGCPKQVDPVCDEGQVRCGEVCVDASSDAAHCGACGNACGASEVCSEGICGCAEGTESCDGTCADLTLDALNCGTCGNACQHGQVCEAGACAGPVVVAACGGTAQLVAVGKDGTPGTPVQLTTSGLQSLGLFEQNVLASSYGADVFQLNPSMALTAATATGFAGANAFLSEPPYVYVTNTNANSVVVLEQTGGSASAGYAFTTVGEVVLGENTSPQAIARVGSKLYVPLYGNLFGAPEAGQRVAVLDATNPAAPVRVPGEDIDLSGLDLQPFPGAQPFATPYGIVERGGNLYLPLNSLTAAYEVGGPGLLAKITLPAGVASTVALDPSLCENVGDVEKVGDWLAVSCVGSTTYDGSYNVVAVEKTSVLLLDAADAVIGTYAFTCTSVDCPIAQTTRLAVSGSRVYVGDGKGRLVILDASAAGFTEVRGFTAEAPKAPALVCPASTTASNHIADLVVVE